MSRGIVSALALALLGACSEQTAQAIERPAVSSSPVAWVPARATGEHMLLEAPARVIAAPDGRAAITAPLRARVVAVLVEPGATVEARAPLIEVMLPDAAAAAAAYLAAAEELAAYERRGTELASLRAEGLVRASEVSAVELEIARLRGARDVAGTTLRAAGIGPDGARALAASGGRTTLRSPIGGVVMAVAAVPGASHAPEDVLAEVAAGPARRVEARLVRPLPARTRVELVTTGSPPIAAVLVGAAGVREPDGTTRTWFELATPMPAGTAGRIRVAGAVDGAAIPATAIGHSPDGEFVWRSDRGVPRKVPVRVVASSGGDAIVEGIAVGDEIASAAVEVTP